MKSKAPGAGLRLDQAIADRFPDVSRREARRLLVAHRIAVNGKAVSVASRPVFAHDVITIVSEGDDIEIVYASAELIVINKPPLMGSQPMKDRTEPSAYERLSLQLKKKKESGTLFVVHRLDYGTSGLLIFARTQHMAARLSAALGAGEIDKRYLAIVRGSPASRTIEDPITSGGVARAARTEIVPLSSANQFSLLEARITTGRMHQIRIHLSGVGHAVVGDRRYGAASGTPDLSAARPLLHAWKLSHELLGDMIAAPPTDFREALASAGIAFDHG